MRVTWWVALLATLLGTAVGIGSSWREHAGHRGFGFSKPLANSQGSADPARVEVPEGRARVQIDGDGAYDFGVMSRDETRNHTFVVRNTGTVPLTLRFLEKSCKCTDVQMSRSEVPPGEAAQIELNWRSNDYKLDFSQTARFQTNDPARLELDLTVQGRVLQIVRPVPLAVSYGNVLTQQPRDMSIQVFGYRDDDLSVDDVTFLLESTADHFRAEVTPLPTDALEREPGAQSGSRVTLNLQPGLPLGPFHQRVSLRLNQDDLEPIVIPIEGVVVGNVTVMGPPDYYDAERGLLRLGTLSGDSQHERQLWLLIKGEDASAIHLKVTETDPEGVLQASLGEPVHVGRFTRQSLQVRIVPAGRVINRLGSQQGGLGRIVIESDHADAHRILVHVAFALEGQL